MNNRKAVHSTDAPGALGPYSQAIDCGDFVFCSGQVPIDPATGKLIGGDVAEQTRRVLKNLEAVLVAADLSLDHVVKTTIYLASMDDFQAVNGAYAEFFGEAPPARAAVEVSRLPIGAQVEIDAIARR
jgi:2-iminobutanoate/2-iminopropanoate deaminase